MMANPRTSWGSSGCMMTSACLANKGLPSLCLLTTMELRLLGVHLEDAEPLLRHMATIYT